MRKFLVLFFVLMLMFSLEAISKDAFSFEANEYADGIIPPGYEGIAPFITGYRHSKSEDFSVVEGVKWWHGSNSIRMTLTHEGRMWNIMAKNLLVGSQPENLDTTFLDRLSNRDSIYYYVYIPWNAHIDSIFIFVRNAAWEHDEYTVYYPRDLRFGKWNELKDGISDNQNGSDDAFSTADGIIQSDFEVHTNPEINPPACTLYIDAISSKGRVPRKYMDTTGQAGIDDLVPNDGLLSVSKSSINRIEYFLSCDAPVMVKLYDLTGSKKLEIPVGFQPAGLYTLPVDLSPGVYFAEISTDKESKIGKVISAR